MEAKKYKIKKSFSIGGIIIFGSLYIIGKSQLKLKGLYYPVFQSCLFSIGEVLCLVILLIRTKVFSQSIEKTNKYSELPEFRQNRLTRLGNYAYIISGFFEFLSNLLETVAFNILSPASIVSLKCLVTLYVLYYRFFHINRSIFRHQKLGLAVFLAGILTVIIALIVDTSTSIEENRKIICIFVMIVAEGFAAVHLVSIEYLMSVFNTAPEVVNGIKGATGIFLSILLYLPFGLIFRKYFDEFRFDEPFEQLGSNRVFIGILCGFIVNLTFFSYFVSKTLEFTEALTVCTVESGWIFIIWVLGLTLKTQDIDYLQIFGGVFIILGLLIYNGVITMPWCGMKKSVKACMEQNKEYLRQRKKTQMIPNALFLTPSNKLDSL